MYTIRNLNYQVDTIYLFYVKRTNAGKIARIGRNTG